MYVEKSWQKNATVSALAYQMYQHVMFLLATEDMDAFLIFDRYFKYLMCDKRTKNGEPSKQPRSYTK